LLAQKTDGHCPPLVTIQQGSPAPKKIVTGAAFLKAANHATYQYAVEWKIFQRKSKNLFRTTPEKISAKILKDSGFSCVLV
jgi:hypothetical protein